MKKVALLFAIVLASTFTFAQKANVNKALSKAQAEENPDFDGAKELIESALVNDETKNQAKTWWTAGRVYELSAKSEQMKGEGHEMTAGADAMREYDLYMRAYELDQMPNAKGKVKPVYERKIKESLASLYKSNILLNYSVTKQSDQQWADAYNVMMRHLGIIELDMLKKDEKMMADTLLQKRSLYTQLEFYAAVWAWQAEMRPEAAQLLQNIKNTGYKSQEVYEYLATIYDEMKDTVNYEAVLREGSQVVPQSQFLIGNLINLYVDRKQTKEAIEYLQKAIERTPTAQLYNVLGSVQETAGDLDNALVNFNKALQYDANYADAIANIGRLYYNQGVKIEDDATAEKDPIKVKEMTKLKNEKIRQALPYFEKAYELNQEDAQVEKMLRQTYYRLIQVDPKLNMKFPEIRNGYF